MTEKALAPLFTDGWRPDCRLPVGCEIHDMCMARLHRVKTLHVSGSFLERFQATRYAAVSALKEKYPPPSLTVGLNTHQKSGITAITSGTLNVTLQRAVQPFEDTKRWGNSL